MREINLETWPRREIFSFYNSFSNPHFNMCANVDLTEIYPVIKQGGVSFNLAVVYLLARTANHIPDFRYRIHGDSVVEYEIVHPSSTIMTGEDLFSFCTFEYAEDFSDFATKAVDTISYVKENPAVKKDSGDDLLFMTAIPWVTFTSFMHPLHLNPPDSVPRFAWGKFYLEGERIKMPLSVQAHHALMDGIHIGRFYEKLQFFFDHPELAL